MAKKPRRKVEQFDGANACAVCSAIDAGPRRALPICTRCAALAPADLMRMDKPTQRRAVVMLGIGVALELLKRSRVQARRKRR